MDRLVSIGIVAARVKDDRSKLWKIIGRTPSKGFSFLTADTLQSGRAVVIYSQTIFANCVWFGWESGMDPTIPSLNRGRIERLQ